MLAQYQAFARSGQVKDAPLAGGRLFWEKVIDGQPIRAPEVQ
jgi:hypothetical protein